MQPSPWKTNAYSSPNAFSVQRAIGRLTCLLIGALVLRQFLLKLCVAAEQTSKKALTQRKILDAALSLFSEKGFDAVSIEEIGALAGVAHGTIFWHFGSKDSLYLEVAKQAAAEYARFFHPAIEKSTQPSDLVDLALLQYQYLKENPKQDQLQMSLVFECSGPHPELKPALQAVNGEYYKGWQTWVDKMESYGFLHKDTDVVGLAHTLTGGLGAIVISGVVNERDMTDAIIEFSRILIRGAFENTSNN